jgi:hypothetical protein
VLGGANISVKIDEFRHNLSPKEITPNSSNCNFYNPVLSRTPESHYQNLKKAGRYGNELKNINTYVPCHPDEDEISSPKNIPIREKVEAQSPYLNYKLDTDQD